MHTSKFKVLAFSAALVFASAAPSQAATVIVNFSGKLSSAVNNSYDDPDVPSSDFFKVGQSFSGSFSYDTDVPGYYYDDFIEFDLSSFNVIIGGVDFSTRFMPHSVFRSSDGGVSFVAGGASQGGSTSIDLNLGSFYGSYPTVAELDGKTASFRFDDYVPFGGQLSGIALLDAGGAVSSVPEPYTWILMVLGFGTIGYSLRRRNAIVRTRPALPA